MKNKTPRQLIEIMCDIKIEKFRNARGYDSYSNDDYELVEIIKDYAIEITYNYFKKDVSDEVFFKKAYEWIELKEKERKAELEAERQKVESRRREEKARLIRIESNPTLRALHRALNNANN